MYETSGNPSGHDKRHAVFRVPFDLYKKYHINIRHKFVRKSVCTFLRCYYLTDFVKIKICNGFTVKHGFISEKCMVPAGFMKTRISCE